MVQEVSGSLCGRENEMRELSEVLVLLVALCQWRATGRMVDLRDCGRLSVGMKPL